MTACVRYFGSDGTICATHGGHFTTGGVRCGLADRPTAPLPDEELAAIEARDERFDHHLAGTDADTFSSEAVGKCIEDRRTLLAALRAERAARERVEAAARAASEFYEDEFITFDNGDGASLIESPMYQRLEAVMDRLRAALAPDASEGAE